MSDKNKRANIKPQRRLLNKVGMGLESGKPLEASAGGIEALRSDIQRLMDMEAIRQLKYAYFRCIDTANLEELATLIHEDVLVHLVGGSYEWQLQGKAEYVENIKKAFSKQSIGHHNGHHPEIQMLSETEATAIWYLADSMWMFDIDSFTTGTSLYWDRYVKVDGRWLIRETRYERIYEINDKAGENPAVPASHYLAVHGAAVN